MELAQTVVPRIVRKRTLSPLVRCTYAELDQRLHNDYGSCDAMVPYTPRRPCPVQAIVSAPPPGAEIIEGNAALVDEDTGEVSALQVIAVPDLANRLAFELGHIKWDAPINARGKSANEGRLSGMVVTHRTFGYTPPVPLRRRWSCAASRFDIAEPTASEAISEYIVAAEHVFRTQAGDKYEATAGKVLEEIPAAWRIAGSPWTSGIINNTAALPYHRDSNNIKGSWSAMLAIRNNVEGGLLHLADYDVWLRVPNGSISIFDGQSVLHGVSPFKLSGPNAYRYTIVSYARKGLRVCCPDPKGEPRRAALAATAADDKRRNK